MAFIDFSDYLGLIDYDQLVKVKSDDKAFIVSVFPSYPFHIIVPI